MTVHRYIAAPARFSPNHPISIASPILVHPNPAYKPGIIETGDTLWPSCARCHDSVAELADMPQRYVDEWIVPVAFWLSRVTADDVPSGGRWRVCLRCHTERYRHDGTKSLLDPTSEHTLDRILCVDIPDRVFQALIRVARMVEERLALPFRFDAELYDANRLGTEERSRARFIVGPERTPHESDHCMTEEERTLIHSPEALEAVRAAMRALMPTSEAAKGYARRRRENAAYYGKFYRLAGGK